jgi:hypothetical protein
MRIMRMCALALPLAALAGPALAQADVTADPGSFTRIEAGILCVDGQGHHEPAPDTRLGYVNIVDGDIVLGLAARRVPAIPGLAFGVVAMVAESGGTAGVSIIVTHPPMGNEGSTRDVWQNDFVTGAQTASFFRFEFPEEQVPGEWTIQAVSDSRVFYTARFQVVDPAAMPGFVNPCREPPPIS